MVSRKSVAMVACGTIGVVFLVAGCVLIHVFANAIHSEVKEAIPLKKGSESYKNWLSPKSPIYFQVWMFDVVNYLEVMQKGEKPVVVQQGPYTYKERREKVNITYNENGTLSYKENRWFYFQRDMSVGPENDTFHCVNLPVLTVIHMLKYQPTLVKDAVNLVLKGYSESLFIKLSVSDLMWGYKDAFLEEIHKLAVRFGLKIPIPEEFGLFYNGNGTDDGVYQIYDGLGPDGITNFGQIASWNGNGTLDYWTSSLANMVNGSDGTIYPPFISTSETKYLFSSDLCRSLGMDYSTGVTNRGIDMDRFVAPDILFGNATINPYNAGFCTPAGQCLPSGLLNVSVCREGAPIVMSMPHFLGCDPEQVDAIRGLHPNREEHQSFIDIEPMTGVVMRAGKRLQINVYMDRVDGFPDTYNIKRTYFPVMWLNESALISPSDAGKFRDDVLNKIKLTDAVKYGLIAVGAFILACLILLLIKDHIFGRQNASRSKIVNEFSDETPIVTNGNMIT